MVKSGGAVTVTDTRVEWEIDPLVAVTVTTKDPWDVAQTVRGIPADIPEDKETLVAASVAVSPVGETDAVNVMVPLNPLMLVTVTVETAHAPAEIVRLEGVEVTAKSDAGPLLLKVAVWTVAGTGAGVPLAMSTQMLPLTLVPEHPV